MAINKFELPQMPTASEIETWLVEKLATYLKINPDDIDLEEPFAYYKLDSAVAVSLTNQLANWLNRDLEPILFWEYPTINAVTQYLESAD